jgi:hypothetical protein
LQGNISESQNNSKIDPNLVLKGTELLAILYSNPFLENNQEIPPTLWYFLISVKKLNIIGRIHTAGMNGYYFITLRKHCNEHDGKGNDNYVNKIIVSKFKKN